MRVLHVQKASGIGGSERHLLMLLPQLVAAGIEASAVVLEAEEGRTFTEALRARDVDARTIPAGPHLNPSLVWRLRQHVQAADADLVHTHLIHADVHGQPAARLAGAAGVSTIHGTPAPYRTEPARVAAAVAGHLAQRVVAISEHVARFALERRLTTRDRLLVIPYGIDLDRWSWTDELRADQRQALGLGGDDVAVIVASRLIPHKGHDFLIRAFADASRRDRRLALVVAGDGPLRSALERQATDEGIAEKVQFLGFVEDVRALMHAADAVAFPTMPGFGEGFGLVNIEAMALARPLVATGIDSIPEIVVDGEVGFLVAPGDWQALSDALVRLASDPGLRQRLGAAGRARVESLYTLERMAAETIVLYEDVLRDTPRHR